MNSINYRKNILKERLETERCQRTTKYPETTDYITGYTRGHDNVAKQLNQQSYNTNIREYKRS
jgi:hypothetical protein